MSSKRIGSYCGFYKSMFLRSSYEYVYCIILENENIEYTVEEITYDLPNGCRYKPDFHLYKDSKLLKIVEIKSSNPNQLNLAIEKIELLSKIVNVPVEIITYDVLKLKCLSIGLNIINLISEWKSISVGKNLNIGKLNPMYGKIQSDEAKILIGLRSTERCLDLDYRNKIRNSVLKYYENGGVSIGPPLKRKTLKCPICNCDFETIQSSNMIYCSNKCKLIYTTKLANDATRNRFNSMHEKMKLSLYEVFKDNIDLLESMQRNKIYSLVKNVFSLYNIKDIRVFKFLYLGSYNSSFEEVITAFKIELYNYLKYMPN